MYWYVTVTKKLPIIIIIVVIFFINVIIIIIIFIIVIIIVVVIIIIITIIIIIIIIIIIFIRYKSFTNTRKNRKKELQKNNVQNTVIGEHIRVDKENDISNASNCTKTDENKKDQNRNNEVKSVAIISDSMIKHLSGWDMSKKAHKSGCKLYVKSFPGAKTSCMKDYVKPSLRSTPNHFILHVGTNDLNSNQTSGVIAKKIVDLATSLKNNQRDVSVSNIILRTYNSKLNAKRCNVNQVNQVIPIVSWKKYLSHWSFKEDKTESS